MRNFIISRAFENDSIHSSNVRSLVQEKRSHICMEISGIMGLDFK
ncbi:hypothetical protein APA_1055 [Pseudanabaena sp. lw0831]|nr:hypothetical protein APA_1055 [Pseudanabaena sp. lw0831]